MPHAARVAELLLTHFQVESEFVKGDGGILEVRSGETIIWTNQEQRGVKPTDQQILDAYRAFLDRSGP